MRFAPLLRPCVPQATSAAVALGVGVATSPTSAVAADSSGDPKGLPASGYFVQHAVFKVGGTRDYFVRMPAAQNPD